MSRDFASKHHPHSTPRWPSITHKLDSFRLYMSRAHHYIDVIGDCRLYDDVVHVCVMCFLSADTTRDIYLFI